MVYASWSVDKPWLGVWRNISVNNRFDLHNNKILVSLDHQLAIDTFVQLLTISLHHGRYSYLVLLVMADLKARVNEPFQLQNF